MVVNFERLKEKKMKRIRRIMIDKELDAVILTSFENVRYLTDVRPFFSPSMYIDGYAALMLQNSDPFVVAPFIEGAKLGYSEMMPPIYIPAPCCPDRWMKIFKEILKRERRAIKCIGVDYFPLAFYNFAKKEFPNVEFKPIIEDIMKARAIKFNEEIELLKESASIVDLGAEAGFNAIEEGKREHEIVAEIIHTMADAGIEALPWYPDVRSGERTLESIFPSHKRIKRGDPVIFDIGCVGKGGYWADLSRTGFAGKPSEDLRQTYKALYDAYIETIKTIRPGMKASQIEMLLKYKLQELGYPYMNAPTGHGIGLGIDYPWITVQAREKDMELQPNMVVCIEPVTYSKSGAVKLEDSILITEGGQKILNKARYVQV